MRGIGFALLTAIISGVAIFYSKLSVAKIDPLVMATVRNSYVGILFLLYMGFGKRLGEVRSLSRKDLVNLLLIGVIGGSIPFFLFFSGIKMIGPQTANIIHKSLFVWVALFAGVFLREKISAGFIVAGLLVGAGTYLFTPVKLALGQGEALVLAATLMWAVENVLAKKILPKVSSELVGLFRMGTGGIVLFMLTVMAGKVSAIAALNSSQLQTLFIGGSILFFYVFSWYKALKHAPANLVTLLLTFSLIVGNILNGSFAGVKFGQTDLYSMALIGAGVLLLAALKLGPSLKLRGAK